MGIRTNGIRNWVNAALAFVYPELCQICSQERAPARDGFVCHKCRQQVRFIEPPFCERCGLPFPGDVSGPFQCANCHDVKLHFHFARSAVTTSGPVLEVIHRYKYERALWFEPFLAELLIGRAAPLLLSDPWQGIVPVPLHPVKHRAREFNQSERLAACLSRATGIPCMTDLLSRVHATRTQTTLSRPERAENVRNAFALRRPRRIKGMRIVLLDDVMTTGATTSACARVLRSAGAAQVCVWTVARGIWR